jgi:DNA repair photolyase
VALELEIQEYHARRILNVHEHVDGPWFWTKYSAHPYVGCRSGCEFCYCRGGRYLGQRDPDRFDTLVGVKANAADLLRKELTGRTPDVIACGDWQQPVESRFRISREMLKVVRDFSFPLFVVERSPLVVRDLDLLGEINERAWVGVAFSISNLDPELKHAFEPHSPGIARRLQAMSRLAEAGVLVGTALMPIVPFLGDRPAQLEAVIQATKDHGGEFALAGGMTMAGAQSRRTLEVVAGFYPPLEEEWRRMYRWPQGGKPRYSPPDEYINRLGRLVRELCAKHGIWDRIPRYVRSGPLAANKRIAERLFLKTYDFQLEGAPAYLIWAYRKAAWTMDELQASVQDLYLERGEEGLLALPTIGKRIASEISHWLEIGGFASTTRGISKGT